MKKIFVGIDISKEWIDVCVTPDGKTISHQQFENNRTGFSRMLKWIKQFSKQQEEWLICMEHTGIYAQPLWQFSYREKHYILCGSRKPHYQRAGNKKREER